MSRTTPLNLFAAARTPLPPRNHPGHCHGCKCCFAVVLLNTTADHSSSGRSTTITTLAAQLVSRSAANAVVSISPALLCLHYSSVAFTRAFGTAHAAAHTSPCRNRITIRCHAHHGAAPPAAPPLSKLPYCCCFLHPASFFPVMSPFRHLELSRSFEKYCKLSTASALTDYCQSHCTSPALRSSSLLVTADCPPLQELFATPAAHCLRSKSDRLHVAKKTERLDEKPGSRMTLCKLNRQVRFY